MSIDSPADSADQSGAQGQCIACGSRQLLPWRSQLPDYITGERFDIVRCADCGLGVTRPAPAAAELARYYPARYRGDRHAGTGSFRTRRRAAALQRRFSPGFAGRLLDLGAGAGEFALFMRQRGWDVSATEIDTAAVESLRGKGIDAQLASAAGGEGWQERFDAVTCWHVLEHVNEPVALLQATHAALKPGGVFQVTVPNLASWQARLGGRHWFHLDVPRHLFHFTPEALELLMRRHGYAVEGRTSFALEYDWFGAIQTPLNALLPRANVLFEALTRVNRTLSGSLLVSALLAPALASVTVLPTLAAWPLRRGATLTLSCRRQG